MDALQVQLLLDSTYFFVSEMKELFLTSTQPKHFYKSAKYFRDYFALRSTSFFGQLNGRHASYIKKYLMLKKIFRWYYSISSPTFFRKLFRKSFLKKRISFRSLIGFFQLLERNILTLCVRGRFSLTFKESAALVRGGFIFVNGIPITFPSYFTRIGDTLEILRWENLFLLYYRGLLFFADGLLLFRLNYFISLFNFFFLQKAPKLKESQLIQTPADYKSIVLYLKT